MKIRNKIIALVISLIAIPSFVNAQMKTYAGLEYRWDKVDTGVTAETSKLDEKDHGYSIILGTEVNKNLDIELSYNKFADATVSGSNAQTFRADGDQFVWSTAGGTLKGEQHSYGIALKPKAELTKGLDIVGTLGYHRWYEKDSITAANAVAAYAVAKDNDYDFFYGVGLKYNMGNLAAGISYKKYQTDMDITSTGIELSYKF